MEDNETAASAAASTFFPPRPPECGNFEDVAAFRFWFDGVLVSVIAVVGFVGNLLALIVLSRDLSQSLLEYLRGQSINDRLDPARASSPSS